MLQASLGVVADAESREGFIDFDSVPKDGDRGQTAMNLVTKVWTNYNFSAFGEPTVWRFCGATCSY